MFEMFGVRILASIHWVRSLLSYRVEEAVIEFSLSCSCLGVRWLRRKRNWK